MYQPPILKILPEYTFAVPLGTSMWEGYKVFNTLGEAIHFTARMFGSAYKFVETKDHPSKHNFTAIFEYVDENGEKQLKRKTITINNYDEVYKKYHPVKVNRIHPDYHWDEIRALFGVGPLAK